MSTVLHICAPAWGEPCCPVGPMSSFDGKRHCHRTSKRLAPTFQKICSSPRFSRYECRFCTVSVVCDSERNIPERRSPHQRHVQSGTSLEDSLQGPDSTEDLAKLAHPPAELWPVLRVYSSLLCYNKSSLTMAAGQTIEQVGDVCQ